VGAGGRRALRHLRVPLPGTTALDLHNCDIAAVFAYSGVAAFGTPVFLLLRASKRTAFWIAPALGFAVGVATWLVFIVLFGLSLGDSWSFVSHDLASNSAHLWAFLPTGALGAAVGATLWLIARPDRHDLGP
jgi:hypothetical protein